MPSENQFLPSKPILQVKAEQHPAKRRVLLVDDHPLTREGLANIINRQADLEVFGQANDAVDALAALSAGAPDLVVTDLTMPKRSGLEFLKDVRAMLPKVPVLVLSMHDEMYYAERALRAGARGYLMKDAGVEKVLEVMRLILSGQAYVSPLISMRLLDVVTSHNKGSAASPIEKLSDREFEVFQMIGRGRSTKEVAEHLNLSSKTVEAHRAHLKKKLQLNDSLSLVHYAVCWMESHGANLPQV